MSESLKQANSTDKPRTALPWRGLVLALALFPLNAYWLIHTERIFFGPYVTTISLFANVLFILIIVALLNLLIARLWKPLLTAADLGALYALLALGSGLAGMDNGQVLVQVMACPYYFGDETTRWLQHFGDELSPWLVVSNREALLGFFRGQSSLYTVQHLRAWALPTLSWVVLWSFIFWGALAINSLLAPRWLRRERLTYPIVQVPLEIINRPQELFSNRIMWMGFAVAGGIGVLNGLNFLYPAIPAIKLVGLDMGTMIHTRPWSAIGWTPITFYPFVIGLGFLMPTDLIFSCWFFFWVWKAQQVFSAMVGLDQVPDAPWITQQTFGAVLGLAAALIWSSRQDLADAISRKGAHWKEDEAAWPMKPRVAVGLLVICIALLVIAWHLAGTRVTMALYLFLGYYLMGITLTRIRAEFGSPVHDFHWVPADYMVVSVLGSARIPKGDLVGLSYFWGFNRAQRSNPMPQHAESLKVAEQTSIPLGWLQKWSLATVPFGVLVGIWAFTHLGYQLGIASKFGGGWGFGYQCWDRTNSWIAAPTNGDPRAFWAILTGLGTVLALYSAKLRFVGWPFHPIGYAVSSSWSINLIWLPLLIAWLAKVLIMRHGGLRSFRKVRPFFVGLILGDTLVGCVWSLIGVFSHLRMYNFWGA